MATFFELVLDYTDPVTGEEKTLSLNVPCFSLRVMQASGDENAVVESCSLSGGYTLPEQYGVIDESDPEVIVTTYFFPATSEWDVQYPDQMQWLDTYVPVVAAEKEEE